MNTLIRSNDAGALIKGEGQAGEWCLCRWMERNGTRFCGPLSQTDPGSPFGGLGFPYGQIGDVLLFDSEEDAARVAATTSGKLCAFDVPTRLQDLHFWVRAYSHYDGSEAVLYDDGKLAEASGIRDLAVGRAHRAGKENVYKIVMECRFVGTPPVHRLKDAEPEKLLP